MDVPGEVPGFPPVSVAPPSPPACPEVFTKWKYKQNPSDDLFKIKVLLVDVRRKREEPAPLYRAPVKMSKDISVLKDTVSPDNDCGLGGPVALIQGKELSPLNAFVIK